MSQSESVECRLLIDEPADGIRNMAVDEALLESTAKSGIPVLRFYAWSRPTLSLGYFQRHADRQSHTPSRSCSLVRRSTGGGAILHDQELTYSVVWPSTLAASGSLSLRTITAQRLYETVHGALQRALAEYGIVTQLAVRQSTQNDSAFLCFQRRGAWDVLVGDTKIAGSAQRRARGAILQHGSLLLRTSVFSPETPGLTEVCDRDFAVEDLLSRWSGHLAERANLVLRASPLQGYEDLLAGEAVTKKYGRREWTQRR